MFGNLRARYYVVVVGIATVPILLLGFLTGLRSASELERQSLVLQTELATRVEREIASFLSARVNELRVLEQTNVLAGMDQRALAASLGRLLAHGQIYQELFVLAPDGQVRVFASRTDVAPRDPERWRQAPWAKAGYWTDDGVYVGSVEFDAGLREPLVDVAVPILQRRTGDVESVLLANTRFKSIWDLLADLDLPSDTEAFVVDAGGRILAHRSPAEVLSARIFQRPAENGRHRMADGSTSLVVTQPLSMVGAPAYVVVTRPLDSALANVIEMRTTILVSAALLLLGASALAYWQSREIVRPVEDLAQSAGQISDGDLDTKIEVSGPDEIQALGRTLQGMTGRLKDTIADLKRSEFAERQRAMVTLQSIGDAVITTDPDGHVTYINPVASRLTGWSFEEAMDRPLGEVFRIISATTREAVPNPVLRCLASGEIVGLANDTLLLSRDGSEHAISDSAAPIREIGGAVIGVVMVFQDVTERQALEQRLRESQKMEAIGKLSGGIAHDFNNLMQVIQGNAELLAEDPDFDPNLTAPILRATERGSELTGRLLAFARKQPLLPQPVDIARLLKDMLPILDRTLGETIEITLRCDDPVWPAETDPGQLETALLNLALNARDAMPQGGTLTVRCAKTERAAFQQNYEGGLDESDFVLISVSDTGEGMSEETRTKAIDPFFTTKGVGEGSGLGLSMVYGFVMQTGGHMDIESAEGAGTTVTLYLPRSRTVAQSNGTAEPLDPQGGVGEAVLVVEDDAEVRTFVTRTLQGLGYRVTDVGRVSDARAAIAAEPGFDLVLTDVVLPGSASGLDFALELSGAHPELPVLLMSGYPEAMAANDDTGGHPLVLLNKPFQRTELATAVRRALDQRRSHPPD
ncbi:MAG: cache domain-containing protein [Rhodobacter sp.]|nr:cache domain-containing protein [Rhodobacter sp.]